MAIGFSLCLVLLVVFSNLSIFVVQGGYQGNDCPGGRGTVTGVCYGYDGDPCSDVIPCDTDLGYSCRPSENISESRCFGWHKLRATSVGQTFFSVVWDDFMSLDYPYEYSARLTEEYNTDLSTWKVQEIGRQPSHNFTYLTPGTVYFVMVGTWRDASFSSYSNYTEVLIVRTVDVSECRFQSMILKVGESIQDGCLSKCACLATGRVQCGPVCNNTNSTGTESDENCVEVKSSSDEKHRSKFAEINVLDIRRTSVSIKIRYLEKHLQSILYFCISHSGYDNSTHRTPLHWNSTNLEVRHLVESNTYEVWVEYSINNISEVVSPKTQFTTQQTETTEPNKSTSVGKFVSGPKSTSSKSSVYLGIILATTVILVLLVMTFILIWRRKKRKSEQLCQADDSSTGNSNKHNGISKLRRFVSKFDIVTIDKEVDMANILTNRTCTLNFRAFGENFTLVLSAVSVRTNENLLTIVLDGKILPPPDTWKIHDETSMYKGHIKGYKDSYAFGRLNGVVFDGIFRVQKKIYYMEPFRKYESDSKAWNRTVIYRHCDIYDNVSRVIDDVGARSFPKLQTSDEITDFNVKGHLRSKRMKRTSGVTSSYCSLHVVADHTFYRSVGGNSVSATVYEIKYQVGMSDVIFRGTDFDGDGVGDNVGFEISQITIFSDSNANDYRMGDTSMNAQDYLNAFSTYNHDQFCLGIAFTYRDFSDGLVGLAWVASSDIYGPVGGICQRRVYVPSKNKVYSYNTAMVTMINYGARLPSYKAALVLTHEFGHSFGSSHDKSGNNACSPGGQYGNYIMHAYASNGGLPNNDKFSTCSVNSIYPVIMHKGTCLIERTGPYCGNSVTENGEECDCGNSATCAYTDNCCTPSDTVSADMPCTYRRAEGKVCSPKESQCCTSSCAIVPSSANKICGQSSECLYQVTCDGTSAACPAAIVVENGTFCSRGRKICQDGICYRSVCEKEGLTQCQCRTSSNLCMLCCKNGSECLPLHSIDRSISPLFLSPGEPCDENTGICDATGKCILGKQDSAINRLKNVFGESTVSDTKLWFQNNWYYVIIGMSALIGLTIIFIKSRRKRHNVQAHARRMGRFEHVISHANAERIRQERLLEHIMMLYDDRIERAASGHQCRELPNAIARLSTFFPTADLNVLSSVAKRSTSEEVAVRMLLIRGYPMRRLLKVPEEEFDEDFDTRIEEDESYVIIPTKYSNQMRSFVDDVDTGEQSNGEIKVSEQAQTSSEEPRETQTEKQPEKCLETGDDIQHTVGDDDSETRNYEQTELQTEDKTEDRNTVQIERENEVESEVRRKEETEGEVSDLDKERTELQTKIESENLRTEQTEIQTEDESEEFAKEHIEFQTEDNAESKNLASDQSEQSRIENHSMEQMKTNQLEESEI
ncbi:hypothetical protein FSP39_004811 [Pinctada imbricata]|uniref:Uncharacterized protein n=1 Tax=Pinctada imbricata TaxID=66713 RepID=A0AA88XUC6_PINIB|nr:hypothetical protein FSP39_004811 [Pinctada imbricata]